ncbi:TonB-dependent receptor [Dyella sp.]|jgi:iron complex outermembrane receptor protein|uniref:TonB-dependent receptor n=1 Tax=Dyella sp. TaxID=1869338 RepID=UPI002CED5BE2|nr:TonB-dependent receptor [Dyella sp.]HTC28522.1 TonB-dependent receptor [Dyella sp.]
MSHRKTLLAASIFAGLCFAGTLYAQDATQTTSAPAVPASQQTEQQAEKANAKQLSTVTVVGIRASLQQSMDTKRNADAIVDAITATDIGKFPATNVAEALAQVPGVTLDHLFGATQRVSIDGIDPSLNLSYLDGHPVAQALWLYGDSPNRGFNYSLLPAEILGQLEIYKTPEARLPEGSLGGTVFMHTVQPLDVPSNTVSGTFGANYNDMTDKNRPNGSVFYSWHNDSKTFGVDVSAQHYEQDTSREGQEIFGYTPVSAISAVNPAIAAEVASGQLKNSDQMPTEINSANFEQIEKRNSIFVNIQYKPNEHFDSTLSMMYMTDSLNNINTSLYPIAGFNYAGITHLTANGNGVVTSGTQVGTPCFEATSCTSTADTFEDNDARASYIRTKGIDWRGTYYGDGWRLGGQVGVSTSNNVISQAFKEIYYGGGFNWSIPNGFNFTNLATANNPNYWADNDFGGNIGYKPYHARDSYAQIDFSKDFDGFVNEVLVGARYASHWESQSLLIYRGVPNMTLNQIGYGGLTNLQGASSIGLGGSSVSHVQTCGYTCIFNAVLNNGPLSANDPVDYWDNTFNVQQQNTAVYGQANFGTDNLHGNLGVRWVKTQTNSYGYYVPSSCQVAGADGLVPWDCNFTNGTGYIGVQTTRYNWLPAFNIAYNLTPDFILRGAASETVAYAPYNELAPFFEANDTVLTATAGNPGIKPYRSVNGDISAEWYFNDQSVIALSGFYKNVLNYVTQETTPESHENGSWGTLYPGPTGAQLVANGMCTVAGVCTYQVTAPVNGGRAKVKGAAISYQQAFGDSGFGLRANYTYSDSRTVETIQGANWLPYNSKNSYTLAPYFEQGPYSASISYNYRSKYLAGGYVAGATSAYTASYKELDASAAYAFNKNFSVSFDMLNLLNSVYKQYDGINNTMLLNEYVSGREFMLEAHFKF